MWRIDAGVARDLGAVIGWTPAEGPVALVAAMAGQVPAGTTAKLEAVAAGAVPPGADPEAVARRIVDDREAGRPSPAWSCWPLSTVLAALLGSAGLGPVAVAAVRRIDDRSPAVDIHSVVLAPDGAGTVLCDPYFGAVVPGPGGARRDRTLLDVTARRTDEDRGRWTYSVSLGRWPAPLAYRVLAPACDPGDVAALCAVSVAFSGAPPTPFAGLRRPGWAVDAHTHTAGGCAVREWQAGRDPAGVLTEHPGWASAAADLSDRAGIPIR